MFVAHAGETSFNQGTFISVIHISDAVWCPRFETEESEDKHGNPGKENTLFVGGRFLTGKKKKTTPTLTFEQIPQVKNYVRPEFLSQIFFSRSHDLIYTSKSC